MEVCYAYEGIGRVIMEMTAADWAAWGSTVGTLAAVWAAFWLYKRQTSDANREKAARRRVLHGILEAYVRGAAERAQTNRYVLDEFFPPGTDNLDAFASRMHFVILPLSDEQRMFDLQSDLLDFGERGGAAIATFIESCRNFDGYREQFLRSLGHPIGKAPVDTRQFHLQQLMNKARVIDSEAKAAIVCSFSDFRTNG